MLHCQGSCVVGEAPAAQRLDLPGLRAQMQRPTLDAGVLYPLFAAMGLDYGPAFQGIVAVHQGDDQLLVELKLPHALPASGAEYVLHPSLMDSALQGSITLIDDVLGPAASLRCPSPWKSLRILAPCTERMWAWVRYAEGARGASSGVVKVDIDLCDAQGMVCVQMRGFSSRSAEGVIPFDDARQRVPAQNVGGE